MLTKLDIFLSFPYLMLWIRIIDISVRLNIYLLTFVRTGPSYLNEISPRGIKLIRKRKSLNIPFAITNPRIDRIESWGLAQPTTAAAGTNPGLTMPRRIFQFPPTRLTEDKDGAVSEDIESQSSIRSAIPIGRLALNLTGDADQSGSSFLPFRNASLSKPAYNPQRKL